MRGMILAAGFGTRLWPLTVDRTKPAVPFLNRPLISYSVEYLKQFGINEIIINLHHEPESIKELLGDGSRFGVSIEYSEEPAILGTSGALDKVRHLLERDTFVVINGKIVTNIDLNAAIRTHRRRGALATLVLRENRKREHFTIVEVNGAGNIARFAGFPEAKASADLLPPPLMFTGIQVLDPAIFNYIPRGVFSHSTVHVYPRAIAEGETIAAHIADGDWFEMSTLERYLDISIEFLHRGGQRVICGKGSIIEEGAEVEDGVIWDRSRVCAGATLRRVVVADDVIVPAGSRFENAIIVRADHCARIERGEVIGGNLVVYLQG